ncbi:hypothetical protein SP19_71 [Salmonella phage 19]|nr:hypothetical protein SP19_71 [Salmonella phage 19]
MVLKTTRDSTISFSAFRMVPEPSPHGGMHATATAKAPVNLPQNPAN